MFSYSVRERDDLTVVQFESLDGVAAVFVLPKQKRRDRVLRERPFRVPNRRGWIGAKAHSAVKEGRGETPREEEGEHPETRANQSVAVERRVPTSVQADRGTASRLRPRLKPKTARKNADTRRREKHVADPFQHGMPVEVARRVAWVPKGTHKRGKASYLRKRKERRVERDRIRREVKADQSRRKREAADLQKRNQEKGVQPLVQRGKGRAQGKGRGQPQIPRVQSTDSGSLLAHVPQAAKKREMTPGQRAALNAREASERAMARELPMQTDVGPTQGRDVKGKGRETGTSSSMSSDRGQQAQVPSAATREKTYPKGGHGESSTHRPSRRCNAPIGGGKLCGTTCYLDQDGGRCPVSSIHVFPPSTRKADKAPKWPCGKCPKRGSCTCTGSSSRGWVAVMNAPGFVPYHLSKEGRKERLRKQGTV